MKTKAALSCALALATLLAGCASVYSKSKEWKMPAGLGHYTLTARMDYGLLTRQATILVNDKEVLKGQSYWWSDQIAMDGDVNGVPIAALCHEAAKQCEVSIAGFRAVTLNF